jgi:hypothetical protein
MPDRICLAMPICSAKGKGRLENITISQFVVCRSFMYCNKILTFSPFSGFKGLPSRCCLRMQFAITKFLGLFCPLPLICKIVTKMDNFVKFPKVKKLILGQEMEIIFRKTREIHLFCANCSLEPLTLREKIKNLYR